MEYNLLRKALLQQINNFKKQFFIKFCVKFICFAHKYEFLELR